MIKSELDKIMDAYKFANEQAAIKKKQLQLKAQKP